MFEIELVINIKMDLPLNNLQKLIPHKTQPTNQPTNQSTYNITCFYVIFAFEKKQDFFQVSGVWNEMKIWSNSCKNCVSNTPKKMFNSFILWNLKMSLYLKCFSSPKSDSFSEKRISLHCNNERRVSFVESGTC